MREISIDIPKNFSNVLASQLQSAAQSAVSSTLMATKSHWEQIAQKRLKTTRNDYMLGLNADNSVSYPDPFSGVLTLRGKWPNMLESGFPAYDMKSGFSTGKRVKQKKDGGWFMTVPFRQRTPGTAGSAVGGSAMPEDIYASARALRGGERLTGTTKDYPASTSWTGYKHKTGIYEGIKKVTKQYDRAKQNQYVSFRRVSDTSDPSSWWHPGFAGINAVDEAERYAKDTFGKVLKHNLKNAME